MSSPNGPGGANLRSAVKRVLVNHDYPPDTPNTGTKLLAQAELFASALVA
jgi:hypothetical protein